MGSIAAVRTAIHKAFSTPERKKLARTGAAMPDGAYPIESSKDLEDAVRAFGRAARKGPDYEAAVKRHIVKRARSLGLTKLLPEDWEGSTKKSANAADLPQRSLHSVLIPDGEAPPEWIELLPGGRFVGNDGRGPYTLENADSVIAASHAGRGLPIDFNHATDYGSPLGLPAPAAGWIRELAVRGGAIFGRVEWTEKGAAAIAAKEYRFISPVFTHTKEGQVLTIERAGLTNNPNLNLTAVAAAEIGRRSAMADGTEGGGSMALSKVIAGLEKVFPDLPPARILEIAKGAMDSDGDFDDGTGADDDDGDADGADAAVDASGDGYDATESADAMRARHADELAATPEDARPAVEAKHAKERAAFEARHAAHSRRPELTDTQIAAMVAKHPLMVSTQKQLRDLLTGRAREKATLAVNAAVEAGKLSVAQRDWALSYAVADPKGFEMFVAKQPVMLARSDGTFIGTPAGSENSLLPAERAVCAQLGIKPEDFLKTKAARRSANAIIE